MKLWKQRAFATSKLLLIRNRTVSGSGWPVRVTLLSF